LNKWAEQTGFRKRKGQLSPHTFIVLMTIGQVGMKHCLKKHQRSRMTSLEMLEAGYDPTLKKDYMS
jgi:hypothetical protein